MEILQGVSRKVALKAYLASDHTTEAGTAKTLGVTISKDCGAFANPNAGVVNATAIDATKGWYYVTLDATDTGTLGTLIVRAIDSPATVDPIEKVYEVVKATNRGMTGLPDVVSGSAGAVITAGTGTAQLAVSGGAVTVGVVLPLAIASMSICTETNNTRLLAVASVRLSTSKVFGL